MGYVARITKNEAVLVALDGTGVYSLSNDFRPPVTMGQMVMMNENPNTAPEIFMAGGGGYVFTRQEAQAAMGGGNSSVHIGGITVMAAPGMNLSQLAREVAKEIGKAARSKQNSNAIYSG